MERTARDTPHGLPHHPTAVARARAVVVRRCVLPVWRSLKAYGLMCLGLVGYDEVPGSGRTPEDVRPRAHGGAGRLPAAGHGPLPAFTEPPPGHPERLRPDMPLTEAERALARQLSGPLTDNDPRLS